LSFLLVFTCLAIAAGRRHYILGCARIKGERVQQASGCFRARHSHSQQQRLAHFHALSRHLCIASHTPSSSCRSWSTREHAPSRAPFSLGVEGRGGVDGCLWVAVAAMGSDVQASRCKNKQRRWEPLPPHRPRPCPVRAAVEDTCISAAGKIDIDRGAVGHRVRHLYHLGDFDLSAGRGFVSLCLSLLCAAGHIKAALRGHVSDARGTDCAGVGCAGGMRRAACGMGKEIDVGVSRLGIGAATDWVAAAARQPLPRHGMAWFVT